MLGRDVFSFSIWVSHGPDTKNSSLVSASAITLLRTATSRVVIPSCARTCLSRSPGEKGLPVGREIWLGPKDGVNLPLLATKRRRPDSRNPNNLVQTEAAHQALAPKPGPSVYQRFATGTEARGVYSLEAKTKSSAKAPGHTNRIRNTASRLKGAEQPQQHQNNVGNNHKGQILGRQV